MGVGREMTAVHMYLHSVPYGHIGKAAFILLKICSSLVFYTNQHTCIKHLYSLLCMTENTYLTFMEGHELQMHKYWGKSDKGNIFI